MSFASPKTRHGSTGATASFSPRSMEASLSSFASPRSQNSSSSTKFSNIRVVVRIRPLSKKEKDRGCTEAVIPDTKSNVDFPTLPFGNMPAGSPPSIRKRRHRTTISEMGIPMNILTTSPCPSAVRPSRSPPSIRNNDAKKSNHRRVYSFNDTLDALASPIIAPPTPTEPSTPPHNSIGTSLSSFNNAKSLLLVTDNNETKRHEYDAVFGPQTGQKEVYERTVGDAVRRNLFCGYNTTIIAYGQTGSGKTYTMGTQETKNNGTGDHRRGNSLSSVAAAAAAAAAVSAIDTQSPTPLEKLEDDDGIIPRAVHDLFRAKMWHKGNVTVTMTYMEIYNDEIRDLLCDTSKKGKHRKTPSKSSAPHQKNEKNKTPTKSSSSSSSDLELRDSGSQIVIKNLTNIPVSSPSDVRQHMAVAASRRSVASTAVNPLSSRSHAICTLHVTIAPPAFSSSLRGELYPLTSSETIHGKLTLVDLAGSERLKQTKAQGTQKQESISINTDLFVLGKVIAALSSSSTPHVPYRDSKLTRILRPSLGGNCCTVVVACVSPSGDCWEESANTLRYASRARAITNKVARNVNKAVSVAEGMALRRENKTLRGQIHDLTKRLERGEGDEQGEMWKKKFENLLEATKTVQLDRPPRLSTSNNILTPDQFSKYACMDQMPKETNDKESQSTPDDSIDDVSGDSLQFKLGALSAQFKALSDVDDTETDSKKSLQLEMSSLKEQVAQLRKERNAISADIELCKEELNTLSLRKENIEMEMTNKSKELCEIEIEVNDKKMYRNQIQDEVDLLSKQVKVLSENSDFLIRDAEDRSMIDRLDEPHHDSSQNVDYISDTSSMKENSNTYANNNYENNQNWETDKQDESFDDAPSEPGSDQMDNNSIRQHATKVLYMAKRAIAKRENQKSSSSRAPLPLYGRNINPNTENLPIDQDHELLSTQESTTCTCSASVFSGNAAHVEFFLPKLGLACQCQPTPNPKPSLDFSSSASPSALSNILRPWQVSFLSSMNIHTVEQLILARRDNSRGLATAMMAWRSGNKMKPVTLKSCFVALHIWTRTAKVTIKTERRRRRVGSNDVDDIDVISVSDVNSVSTLGGDTIDDGMLGEQMEI